MKTYKQLLLGVACATLMIGNVNAASEDSSENEFVSKISSGENVVLFKVHDITPIKNDEGVVSDCEFALTLYNRSPKNVDAATIRLSWFDEGVSNVIDDEDKKALEDEMEKSMSNSRTSENRERGRIFSNSKNSQVQQPKTEDFVMRTLATSVALPQIKPFRQVSLKSKIKSDRCFLMLGELDFSFTSCRVTETESSSSTRNSMSIGRSNGSGETACQSLFRYVSPRDPEYYREFQKVSFNEEAEKKKELREKDINEMQESYDNMMNTLMSASTTLQSIQ